jgi:hypothetical protein
MQAGECAFVLRDALLRNALEGEARSSPNGAPSNVANGRLADGFSFENKKETRKPRQTRRPYASPVYRGGSRAATGGGFLLLH